MFLFFKFNNKKKYFSFYNYINKTLIPTIHAFTWYGNYTIQDPGLLLDFQNKFLGVARLRQKRVSPSFCNLPKALEFLNIQNCRLEFWTAEAAYNKFGPKQVLNPPMEKIWEYTKSKEAGYSLVAGEFGVYDGGGYIAPLGRTLYNSYVNLLYVKNNIWIDSFTAAVFVEFLSYNANSNLFNAIRVIVERSVTGYFNIKTEINTLQLLFVKDEAVNAQNVIFGFFTTVVVIFTLKLAARLCNKRLLALRDLWFFVDILIAALSFICFILFYVRDKNISVFLSKLEKSQKNEFINYFSIVQQENLFTFVAAFLVFVATIRLWKLCRIGKVFQIMEKTVILVFFPIMLLFLCHFVFVLCFGLFGYLIFGGQCKDFKEVGDTLVTMMLLTTSLHSHFDTKQLTECNKKLGKIYFTCFMLISMLITNLYISAIILCYYKAGDLLQGTGEFLDVYRFVVKELLYWKKSIQIALLRLKGGNTQFQTISPKIDEYRYSNCFTLPTITLNIMKSVALHSLELSKKEKLMMKVTQLVLENCENQQVEIFFSGKTKNRTVLVSDRKIIKIAKTAQFILWYDAKQRDLMEQKVQKIMNCQIKKLNYVAQVLGTISHIVSNINVEYSN